MWSNNKHIKDSRTLLFPGMHLTLIILRPLTFADQATASKWGLSLEAAVQTAPAKPPQTTQATPAEPAPAKPGSTQRKTKTQAEARSEELFNN